MHVQCFILLMISLGTKRSKSGVGKTLLAFLGVYPTTLATRDREYANTSVLNVTEMSLSSSCSSDFLLFVTAFFPSKDSSDVLSCILFMAECRTLNYLL